uniref:Uncharacterized protein n=1 Tax=Cyanothece sp. (strain PCC 7425 / ATCC 29141) TaxID=395961 RepID=B8HJQ3_CYAP4
MHKIDINKHIPQERWGEFFETFSHGNKGRLMEIEVLDQEQGDIKLAQTVPLSFIDYQPAPSGDSLIIHTGHNGPALTHSIDDPREVWTGQDANGVVMALDITDQKGNHTILKLSEINGV